VSGANGGYFIFILFAIILIYIYLNQPVYLEKPVKLQNENLNCVIKTQENIVRGTSLTGLIENGQTVKILFD